jgi:hypothetical protein
MEAQFELEKAQKQQFDPLAQVRASIEGKVQAQGIRDAGKEFEGGLVDPLTGTSENPYLTDPSERLLGMANALENPAQFNLVDDGQGGLKNDFGSFGDSGVGSFEKINKGSFWSKVGKIAGIAGAAVGTAATGGVGSPLLAAAISAGGQTAGLIGARQAASGREERQAQNQFALDAARESAFNPQGRLQDAVRAEVQAQGLEHEPGDAARFQKEISSLRNDDFLNIKAVDTNKDGIPDLYKTIFGDGPFPPPGKDKDEEQKRATQELYRNPYVEIV